MRHRTPKSSWIPPGQTVEVWGRVLPGGMLYVGPGGPDGLARANGKGPEPALIDTVLPVDEDNPSPVFRWSPDVKGYFSVGARIKAHYLAWLEGGRQDPEVSTGSLMLFLFGLERRVLFDARSDVAVATELPAICRELQHLLTLHGEMHPVFAGYATELLEFLGAAQNPRPEDGLLVDVEAFHEAPRERRGLPRVIREALGWAAVNGDSVSPELAYAWFIQDPSFVHRSALLHCPQQHKRLFFQRYAEVFRDGLEPDGNYPKIAVTYTPASSTFGEKGFTGQQWLELPDLTARTEHVEELREIGDYCERNLAGFARYAAANPDRPQSLETLTHLPIVLWPPRWRRPFENLAEEAGKGRNLPTLTYGQLMSWLPRPSGTEPPEQVYRAALQCWGLGLETGEAPVSDTSTVVVYPLPLPGLGERPIKGEFELATIAYRLLLFVVKADNAAPHNEYVMVSGKLDLWAELTSMERAQLRGNLAWLMANPKNMLEGALVRLQGQDAKTKARIGEFLLSASEIIGIEGLTLARVLARSASKAPVAPASTRQRRHLEPVAVRNAARKRDAFAIPPSPEPPAKPVEAPSARPVVELDMARVARLKEESAEVGAMLGAIFVEPVADASTPGPVLAPAPQTPIMATPPVDSATDVAQGGEQRVAPAVVPVMGLDAKHSRLARQLCERPSWPRADALALCASLGLLLDGAIERINEASYDTYDDPLVEGEDVLEINSAVSTEIL